MRYLVILEIFLKEIYESASQTAFRHLKREDDYIETSLIVEKVRLTVK